MMPCPSCGKDIPENSQTCPTCGERIHVSNPAGEPTAFITLRRPSQFTALFTKFDIYIDGEKAGTIGNHEQVQIEVEPGKHILYLKLDNFTSPKKTLALKPGEAVRLVCSPKVMGVGINLAVE